MPIEAPAAGAVPEARRGGRLDVRMASLRSHRSFVADQGVILLCLITSDGPSVNSRFLAKTAEQFSRNSCKKTAVATLVLEFLQAVQRTGNTCIAILCPAASWALRRACLRPAAEIGRSGRSVPSSLGRRARSRTQAETRREPSGNGN